MSGRVAIVTGAASGLGEVIAATLAGHGASVAVLDRDGTGAHAVAQSLPRVGEDAHHLSVEVDVSSETAVSAAFKTVLDQAGQLDVLVTSAGVREIGSSLEIDLDEWHRVLDVNLTGTFLCCREAAQSMRQQRSGSIVCISSVAAFRGFDGRPAYVASKAGVLGLMRTLMKGLAPFGIRVNAVCPGAFRTPMTEQSWADDGFARSLELTVPLGPIGTPEDVANSVLFLASDMARYVTGVALPVDGGFTSSGAFDVGDESALFTVVEP